MVLQKSLFSLVDKPPLAWLMPGELYDSNNLEEQRARLVVIASVSTSLLGLFFALIFWLLDSTMMAIPLAVGSAVMLTPPLILRRTASVTIVGNWFAALAFAALCVHISLRGGTRPESLSWLFLPPVAAMILSGTRSGIVWTAISMGTCVLFVSLESWGVNFPDMTNDEIDSVAVGGPMALIWLNALCFLLYSQLQRWLLESLEFAQAEALASSHQSFRTLIEHSPDAIGVLRKEGPPIYFNPALSEMLGYTMKELRTLDPKGVMPDEEIAQLKDLRHKLDDHKHVDVEFESTRIRKDGTQINVEVRNFFTSFQGEPALFMRIRDITERKQMQAQMMRMDRMIAVGTLAAGVAHEINNPLAFVSGNATLLLTEHNNGTFDSWQPPPEAAIDHQELREIFEDITEGAERIRRIVSGLRSFTNDQQDDERTAAVDIVGLLESVIKMANYEIKHRARLVTHFNDVPAVLGDNANLGQVFLNLLVNAAHATPTGSRDDHQIDVRIEQRGEQVCVSISDTGSGIAEEVKPRIFDPFFSTKAAQNGMGLGLYITQSIVHDHEGELTFESTPGVGTTFRVHLPTTDQRPADISGPLPVISADTTTSRLLIIDDEANILRTLQRALPNFEVTTTHSATEAIEQLRAGERFDLILCDLLMPQMSGMQFYAHLQQEFEALASRVIFMTGGTFTDESRESVEVSGRPLVEKPFDLHKLRQILVDELASGRSVEIV
jgi:PAS domain S-box-containing protein